ncbi:magnesium transporter MgtE N-terminal domain-containing protein [Micromonospora sp. NPDC051300]|uniref:magnesium transporter MgtE N-terminal domain-containing protein n=1 Tax=Micromonospora sp. NPDC051300 TaxID=3364286 RepID=UPI0037985EC3
MSEAPGVGAPNPASVTTVAELARELRVLRVHCGNPSVRELQSRAKVKKLQPLPHSTAHDALSGKRGLPRLPVLLTVLRALGLDEADIQPWREAWSRVELDRQGLLDRPDTAVSRAAVPAARAPAGTRIRAVTVQRGAELVKDLALADVVEQLADMPAQDASRRLDLTPAARVVEVLTNMDDRVAGGILGAMLPATAAVVLAAMDPATAAELIVRNGHDQRSRIFSRLSPEAAATIFAAMPAWITVLSQSGVSPETVVRFLAHMPFDMVMAFVNEQAGLAPRWLAVAPAELAGRVVLAVDPERAAGWLDAIPGPKFAEIVDYLPAPALRPVLPHLKGAAIRVLKALGEERLVRLLTASPRDAQGWLGHLPRRLSSDGFRQVQAAIHRGS